MEIDPHTLQQILQRIHQQMRCPQCGRKVPVDFSSVRVVSASALILQLNCEACNAFIVLHATLQGMEKSPELKEFQNDVTANASSSLQMSQDEIAMLRTALTQSGGSFSDLFKKYGPSEENSNVA